jgi:hypothetical protein
MGDTGSETVLGLTRPARVLTVRYTTGGIVNPTEAEALIRFNEAWQRNRVPREQMERFAAAWLSVASVAEVLH